MDCLAYDLPTKNLERFAVENGYWEDPELFPEPVDAREYITEMAPSVDPVIKGLFDVNDKLFIIGPSKSRKTFFTLQFALCIASGKGLLGWEIPTPRRVLLIQCEIQPRHYHRRVYHLSRSLGIQADLLTDEKGQSRLKILNLRGHHIDWDRITKHSKGCDLVILDPFYKVLAEAEADENSSSEVGRVLAECDRLARMAQVAVAIVHHDAKGRAGDRAQTDRGSGSGVVARDYDACIMLTPHQHEKEATVVEAVLRNYPPVESFVAAWEQGQFALREDLRPEKETTASARNKARTGPTTDDVADWVLEQITEPIESSLLKEQAKKELCIGKGKVDKAVKQLVDYGDLKRWREGMKTMIGPPDCQPNVENDGVELLPTDLSTGQ